MYIVLESKLSAEVRDEIGKHLAGLLGPSGMAVFITDTTRLSAIAGDALETIFQHNGGGSEPEIKELRLGEVIYQGAPAEYWLGVAKRHADSVLQKWQSARLLSAAVIFARDGELETTEAPFEDDPHAIFTVSEATVTLHTYQQTFGKTFRSPEVFHIFEEGDVGAEKIAQQVFEQLKNKMMSGLMRPR